MEQFRGGTEKPCPVCPFSAQRQLLKKESYFLPPTLPTPSPELKCCGHSRNIPCHLESSVSEVLDSISGDHLYHFSSKFGACKVGGQGYFLVAVSSTPQRQCKQA